MAGRGFMYFPAFSTLLKIKDDFQFRWVAGVSRLRGGLRINMMSTPACGLVFAENAEMVPGSSMHDGMPGFMRVVLSGMVYKLADEWRSFGALGSTRRIWRSAPILSSEKRSTKAGVLGRP